MVKWPKLGVSESGELSVIYKNLKNAYEKNSTNVLL